MTAFMQPRSGRPGPGYMNVEYDQRRCMGMLLGSIVASTLDTLDQESANRFLSKLNAREPRFGPRAGAASPGRRRLLFRGTAMRPIFISYRRGDAGGHAGRIFDRFRDRFGEQYVFFDQDDIKPGDHFPDRIEAAIRSAPVVMVVIGPDWLDSLNERAANQKIDFVQREVSIAVKRKRNRNDPIVRRTTWRSISNFWCGTFRSLTSPAIRLCWIGSSGSASNVSTEIGPSRRRNESRRKWPPKKNSRSLAPDFLIWVHRGGSLFGACL